MMPGTIVYLRDQIADLDRLIHLYGTSRRGRQLRLRRSILRQQLVIRLAEQHIEQFARR